MHHCCPKKLSSILALVLFKNRNRQLFWLMCDDMYIERNKYLILMLTNSANLHASELWVMERVIVHLVPAVTFFISGSSSCRDGWNQVRV